MTTVSEIVIQGDAKIPPLMWPTKRMHAVMLRPSTHKCRPDLMATVIYISGGQRSGKSRYAQERALELDCHPVYLATSRVWDANFSQRIERHRLDRGPEWQCVEEEKHLSQHDFRGKTVLLDCITLWLTNYFHDLDGDIERVLSVAKKELASLFQQDAVFIIVSNEIGWGGHGENELQRNFADLQGWMNQHIAEIAIDAYLMVSGIPVKIK